MQMPNPQRVPVVDPSTGLMLREWVRYFSELEAAIASASSGSGETIINNTMTNVYQLEEETPPTSAPMARAAMLERRARIIVP